MVFSLLSRISNFVLGKRKVHYKFPGGNEMAEEYSMDTNVLLRRAWKRNDFLCRENEWEIEVGDPEAKNTQLEAIGIRENCSNVRNIYSYHYNSILYL